MNEKNEQKSVYLACERRWVFLLLIFVGGSFGAFTYLARGGVFCNAQTLNLLLTGISVGKGDFSGALYYLVPLLSYFVGVVLSEFLPKPIRRLRLVRWDTALILIEIIAVIALGFIPESAPYQISHIIINIITAMQYNTFRQAQGETMSTTFCTLHMRQMGEALVRWARGSKSQNWKGKALSHLAMIASFAVGGGVCGFLCQRVRGRAILFSLIPLICVFAYLLYSDLKSERDRLNIIPHGH